MKQGVKKREGEYEGIQQRKRRSGGKERIKKKH
jgi:hypothetical protein